MPLTRPCLGLAALLAAPLAGCSTTSSGDSVIVVASRDRTDGFAVEAQGQRYFCQGPKTTAGRTRLESAMIGVLTGRTTVPLAGQSAGYACFRS